MTREDIDAALDYRRPDTPAEAEERRLREARERACGHRRLRADAGAMGDGVGCHDCSWVTYYPGPWLWLTVLVGYRKFVEDKT